MNKLTILILLGLIVSCASHKTINHCKKGHKAAYESYKKMEKTRRRAK